MDAPGPAAADVPADARLADAPHLQALHEPAPALRLVPRHILQQAAPVRLGVRLRRSAGLGGGAVLVHVALGAAFFFLLSFRDAETPREVEIPVEVVAEPPKPTAAGPGSAAGAASAGGQAAAKGGPAADAAKADAPAPSSTAPPPPTPAEIRAAQPAPAPGTAEAANATATPAAPPTTPKPTPAAQPAPRPGPAPSPAPPPPASPPAPKLVAPPPEAARSATQAKENRPANRVLDEHQPDQATREARPVAVPDVMATPDPAARASVPSSAKAPEAPDRPTPPIPAKVPSQADKLAAALPMDASAMPSPFRSVLAGNAAAQINAAYQGVVQGRIRQATVDLAAAASAQHLTGAVAVAFTLDEAGRLARFTVVQSSGSAELDAMVKRAIEGLAPFPPPPPEAEHSFQKAFLVGG